MDARQPCPVTQDLTLAALRMECGALDPIVDNLRTEDVARPTPLPDWNVQQLLAHLVRGVGRVEAYLRAPVPPDVDVSWLGYWAATRELADPADIAQRARDLAAQLNDRPIRRVWRETWRRAVEEASLCVPERVLRSPLGAMRLDHYLTTRVLEVTVHGLDLRVALGLEPVATPLGLEVTGAVLDGLLDGPRPDDLDEVAFVLAATGRRPHGDPRLPVLT